MNYTAIEVHIKDIRVGDTILRNGHIKTVCKNNISNCHFMGKALFGDTYRSGHTPVTKITNLKSS